MRRQRYYTAAAALVSIISPAQASWNTKPSLGAPWRFLKRFAGVAIARFPALANAIGAEINIFGVILIVKRWRKQADDMHLRGAAIACQAALFQALERLSGDERRHFGDDMAHFVKLALALDVPGGAA